MSIDLIGRLRFSMPYGFTPLIHIRGGHLRAAPTRILITQLVPVIDGKQRTGSRDKLGDDEQGDIYLGPSGFRRRRTTRHQLQ